VNIPTETVAGIIVALTAVGFTITARLIYRITRDLARLGERIAHLEGREKT
jgi:hypothetical protein